MVQKNRFFSISYFQHFDIFMFNVCILYCLSKYFEVLVLQVIIIDRSLLFVIRYSLHAHNRRDHRRGSCRRCDIAIANPPEAIATARLVTCY